MEVCAGFELIVIQNATALGHDVLEISKRREVLVGEWLVEDGPEVFSRLKLGRVWGQVDGPDPIWHSQVRCGVPAGAVEPEHDDAIPSRPGLAGKQRQQRSEERLRDPVRDGPEHLARDRLHEGGDVQPLVAVVAQRDRPLAFGRPHPAQDRLQPEAVLVGRPDFDRLVRVLGPRLSDGLLQLFLNASRSSGVAEAGWRGRGFCTDQSIALSASQPRWGNTAASPRSLAIQAATLRLDHRPPSGGGWVKRARKRARSSGRSTLGTPAARPHCAGAGRPAHQDLSRCSARAVARSSAARSSSPPRRPRSCAPAPKARSPESAAPPSDPVPTGTPLPDPLRSDDPQPAPWPASATHGAPAYPLRSSPGIQAESFARNPYNWPHPQWPTGLGRARPAQQERSASGSGGSTRSARQG